LFEKKNPRNFFPFRSSQNITTTAYIAKTWRISSNAGMPRKGGSGVRRWNGNEGRQRGKQYSKAGKSIKGGSGVSLVIAIFNVEGYAN
jgi:hypothetical protein